MADCQPDIAIHKTPGAQQASRLLGSLLPEYFAVDERSIEDLIVFANSLSSELRFYDTTNELTGDWSSFFNWEATAVLAVIVKFPVQEKIKELSILRRKLLFISDPEDRRTEVAGFFVSLQNDFEILNKRINTFPSEIAVKEYFQTTAPILQQLLDGLTTEILLPSSDVLFLMQHHLFNKRIQKALSLLAEWQERSANQLKENLQSYAAHSPQYAVFLAFLKLFHLAQEDLNNFTARHLDFYYKDVLQLKPRAAQPDFAHLLAELHKNKTPFLVKKDTHFLADKDEKGRTKYYKSTSDTAINNAKVSHLFGGFFKDNTYYFNDFLASNASGDSWTPFQESEHTAAMGLAIASPLLYLQGGDRTLSITLYRSLAGGVNQEIPFLETAFDFFLSGAKEWMPVEPTRVGNTIRLNITVDDDAIVPFDPEVHEGPMLKTEFPVLKIISKQGKNSGVKFNKIGLKVDVTNFTHFSLANETGSLDASKTYQPFGPIPRQGNGLIFGSHEFFQKTGAMGTLSLTTDNGSWNLFSNASIRSLQNGQWANIGATTGSRNLKVDDTLQYGIGSDVYNQQSMAGFAKIELTDSNYAKEKFLTDFIKGAKAEIASVALPYIPTVVTTNFSYEVTQILGFKNVSSQLDDFQMFHVYPEGYRQVQKAQIFLTPRLNDEGELFVGINAIDSGDTASLLFQMEDGTANPLKEAAIPQWYYLKGQVWEAFTPDILIDETNGLTSSGLIRFTVPNELALSSQTELQPNILWLKVAIPERSDAICHFLGVHTQAFKVTLTDYENTGVEFEKTTPAMAISKALRPMASIKKFEQPYDSFGGRPAGNDQTFYKRTSERLRHKDRAIASWDYEHLILDEFPEVYRIKCLNHYRYDSVEIANTGAGYVTLVPVAKAQNTDIPVSWKPLVSLDTMKRIKSFLEARTSPHVRLIVAPPKLEYVKISANIKYHLEPGADLALLEAELQDTINAYLSPWAFEEDAAVQFQSEIESSAIIQLIEHQPQVDYLSEFKVYRADFKEVVTPADFVEIAKRIVPQTPYSLFVPIKHSLTSLEIDCCE